MRPTSYRTPFFTLALLAAFYVSLPAQLSATAAEAQSASVPLLSSPPGQRAANNLPTARHELQNPTSAPASAQQAKNTEPAQPQGRVEEASIIPDAGNLLPVAAVVGFSFLVGGIVSGAWKTRP